MTTAPSYLSGLSLRAGRRTPVIMQTEAAECGLACLAMVLGHFGHRIDMLSLRSSFNISLKGATLKHLIAIAGDLDLSARPLRLEIEELPDLALPSILHWNFNHFVVLKRVFRSGGRMTGMLLLDPARGEIRVGIEEISKRFTGVAVELTPTEQFRPKTTRQSLKMREMLGRVSGLKRSMIQIFLLALALEVFALAAPFYMQWVIDGAVLAGDFSLLNILTLGFALLMVIQVVLGLARSWAMIYMATFLNVQWTANVFTHLLRLPVRYFERRHLGDISSRFSAVGAIQNTLTTSFLEAILDGMMATATVVVMGLYSPKLSLIVFASLAIYALLRWAAYRPFRRASEEAIVLGAREESIFLESIRAIQSIKIFNREEQRRSRWLNAVVDGINRTVATQRMSLGFTTAHNLISGVENLLIIWLGARMVIDGQFSVGMLYAFVSYKSTFAGRLYSLIDKFVEVQMLSLHGERLSDIVLSPTEEQERKRIDSRADQEPSDATGFALDQRLLASRGRRPAFSAREPVGIDVRNVCFRYSDADPWVLDGVSFAIQGGESVALVGPSGCGKTTMMKLMTGLLLPTSGEIVVAGQPLSRLDPRDYREQIGVVMQEDQLLTGSLAENISFFDDDPDQAWIEHCATLAAIEEDIRCMPMGYRTLVGEMGSALSGGQKQRVMLARALYRRPKVLFLDEATSHLDYAREARISEAISKLDITRVIVAHRAETIRTADRIIAFGGVFPEPEKEAQRN